MAKFKADQLNELIRTIVRQEVKAVEERMHETIAKTIGEVLSERYLRGLVETARPRGVGRTLHIADGDDQEDEGVPPVAPQTFGGRDIYDEHPSKHDDEVNEGEVYAENLERNDMLSLFFEGTKPLSQLEASAPVPGDVPLEKLAGTTAGKKPITEVWRTLAGVKSEITSPSKKEDDLAALEAREEARLKMLRESLDRPVNG